MPVRVLIAVAIVLFVCLLLFAVDRTAKVSKRERRRRDASRRLAAATAQGKAKHEQRTATEQASGALTSVIPTIHDVDTRVVGQPSKPRRRAG